MRSFEASAPGRCGIVGNPSDIYGGFVVSCSIRARARCRLTFGGDTRLPEDPRLWDAAAKKLGLSEHKVAVDWSTDIPRSSGLSGSTALLAATLACLLAAADEDRLLDDKTSFAEFLRDVERNDAGIMCGYQDAYMICHGGLQRMGFTGKHPVNSGPPASLESIDCLPPHFLLITTGVERLSGAVHGPMSSRWIDGEPAVIKGMTRIAELGRSGGDALVCGDWGKLAGLMEENQAIVAELGGSGPEIDRLLKDCVSCGASAAKLAGAGLGGTVIALAEDIDDLQSRLEARGYTRFMRPEIAPGVMLEKSR